MTLTSFDRRTDENVGGVMFLMFVECSDDIIGWPPTPDNEIYFDRIQATGTVPDWKGIAFTRGTCDFREEQTAGENGYIYKQIVEMNIPKKTYDRLTNMDGMEFKQFLVVVHDNNGKYWMCGFYNQRLEACGMKFKDLGKTGKGETEYNGYGCSFTLESRQRALHVVSTSPEDLGYNPVTDLYLVENGLQSELYGYPVS